MNAWPTKKLEEVCEKVSLIKAPLNSLKIQDKLPPKGWNSLTPRGISSL